MTVQGPVKEQQPDGMSHRGRAVQCILGTSQPGNPLFLDFPLEFSLKTMPVFLLGLAHVVLAASVRAPHGQCPDGPEDLHLCSYV